MLAESFSHGTATVTLVEGDVINPNELGIAPAELKIVVLHGFDH